MEKHSNQNESSHPKLNKNDLCNDEISVNIL